jgi:hypothetical protein
MEQSNVYTVIANADAHLKRVITIINGLGESDAQNLPTYCQALQNTLEQLDVSLVAYNASSDQDRRLFRIGQQLLLVATGLAQMEGEYTSLSTL